MREVEVRLKTMDPNGQARGRGDGRVVFAWGGLPGEKVTVRINRRKRRWMSGVVTEVHEASPSRRPPREEHYMICSPWQVVAEELEPELKAAAVRQLFLEKASLDLPEFTVSMGELFGYRNKMEFSFAEADGLQLAFHERGNWRNKIALDGCALGHESINRTARRIRDLLDQRGVTAAQLKSLVLRCNQRGEVAAGLYCNEPIEPIAEEAGATKGLLGLRVFYSNPQTPSAIATDLIEETGTSILVEEIDGKRFRYSDRNFFQVNVPMFETALRDIRRHALTEGRVYDLYCGVGVLGVCIGAANGVFVESDEEATRLLADNCRDNGLQPGEVITGAVEKVLEQIEDDAVVLLDPPRCGLHPKVVKRLVAHRPQRIVYLSCNPNTQAIDVAGLLGPYRVAAFHAYNFFPRTPHLESLIVLDRQ